MKNIYLPLILILLISFKMSAQEWVVPAENINKLSSFAFSDSTRKAGNDIYNTNCKSCHGDPGKNNVIKLVPSPPDPASEKMQVNTDGGMFYKITQGRVPMPSFKNILPTKDVWLVISYMRSFNDKYIQKIESKLANVAIYQNVKIVMAWVKEKNQVQMVITGVKDKVNQPVTGAEVKLFAKRYFGNLPVDEAKNTDNTGKVLFTVPKDLPGDTAGIVKLTARLTDESAYGEVKSDTTLALGVPTIRPPLTEQRAMWNVVSKAPVWLLLTYTLTVLIVWGFIIYVALQIRAIFKEGSDQEKADI